MEAVHWESARIRPVGRWECFCSSTAAWLYHVVRAVAAVVVEQSGSLLRVKEHAFAPAMWSVSSGAISIVDEHVA